MAAGFRIDWARPVSQSRLGEHSYHATDGERHLLVIVTDAQVRAATALAARMRERSPEVSTQDALEEAIAVALDREVPTVGELRLLDSDFL